MQWSGTGNPGTTDRENEMNAYIIEILRIPGELVDTSSQFQDRVGLIHMIRRPNHKWFGTYSDKESAVRAYQELTQDQTVVAAILTEWQAGDNLRKPVPPQHGSYAWRNITGCMPKERVVMYGERDWMLSEYYDGVASKTGAWNDLSEREASRPPVNRGAGQEYVMNVEPTDYVPRNSGTL
jgi:hypothetical protein